MFLSPLGTRNRSEDSYILSHWSSTLCQRLDQELLEDKPKTGAHAMAAITMDFAVWLSRHSDSSLSAHGGKMLRDALTVGMTRPILIPRAPDMYDETEYATLPVFTYGVYSERFLRAWNSSDLRPLDFYRAGITDLALINHCIAEGVEPDLSVALSTKM